MLGFGLLGFGLLGFDLLAANSLLYERIRGRRCLLMLAARVWRLGFGQLGFGS